jgi:hypothetical protein
MSRNTELWADSVVAAATNSTVEQVRKKSRALQPTYASVNVLVTAVKGYLLFVIDVFGSLQHRQSMVTWARDRFLWQRTAKIWREVVLRATKP